MILRIKAVLDRILSEKTGQSLKKIQDDTDRDFIMGAEEAVTYGLVDSVVSKRDLDS